MGALQYLQDALELAKLERDEERDMCAEAERKMYGAFSVQNHARQQEYYHKKLLETWTQTAASLSRENEILRAKLVEAVNSVKDAHNLSHLDESRMLDWKGRYMALARNIRALLPV